MFYLLNEREKMQVRTLDVLPREMGTAAEAQQGLGLFSRRQRKLHEVLERGQQPHPYVSNKLSKFLDPVPASLACHS